MTMLQDEMLMALVLEGRRLQYEERLLRKRCEAFQTVVKQLLAANDLGPQCEPKLPADWVAEEIELTRRIDNTAMKIQARVSELAVALVMGQLDAAD